jgi:hypothetical protein
LPTQNASASLWFQQGEHLRVIEKATSRRAHPVTAGDDDFVAET